MRTGSLTSEEKNHGKLIPISIGISLHVVFLIDEYENIHQNFFSCRPRLGGENIKISTHNVNNGCLGGFDRRRTQTAAIRVGEVLSTYDPAVSEWSNPASSAG